MKHTHRSVVTLMIAALYGVGLRPGDRYFCPSSPAWGHGLWHGTIAPLALGVAVGTYAGRFEASRIFEALQAFEITNPNADYPSVVPVQTSNLTPAFDEFLIPPRPPVIVR